MPVAQLLHANDFQVLEELHSSTGGSVYLGRHRRTGRAVVLKERRQAELGHGASITHEQEIYERLPPNANITEYLGAYWRGGAAPAAGQRPARGVAHSAVLVMVFEWCAHGDLHSLVQRQRVAGRYLSERQILTLFVQIVRGVRHLHAHGIVHRDLKLENMCTTRRGPDATVKLVDLGCAPPLQPAQMQFPKKRGAGAQDGSEEEEEEGGGEEAGEEAAAAAAATAAAATAAAAAAAARRAAARAAAARAAAALAVATAAAAAGGARRAAAPAAGGAGALGTAVPCCAAGSAGGGGRRPCAHCC